MQYLRIGFDGRQLVVRTNVPGVYDALAHVYSPLVVGEGDDPIGEVEVVPAVGGYAVAGATGRKLAPSVEDAVDLVRYDVVYQTARAYQTVFWMHAGAVERDGVALILPASGGSGKSTLVTLLCEAGWRVLADDIIALEMHRDFAVPYPQVPARRICPGYEVPWPESLALPKRLAVCTPENFGRERMPIGAVVFPTFRFGAPADLSRVRPGEGALEVLTHCINFRDHGDAAVGRAARLAARVPMYNVTYGTAESAVALLDRLAEWDCTGSGTPTPADARFQVV